MMTEKNKMECDDLLKTHEMAMYMLHNLKPYAIEIAEGGKEKDEPEIDIDALLSALFG